MSVETHTILHLLENNNYIFVSLLIFSFNFFLFYILFILIMRRKIYSERQLFGSPVDVVVIFSITR